MENNKNQQTLEFLLVFVAVLLANFSAFVGVIWLIPRLILIETVIWVVLAILAIWLMREHMLITQFVTILKKNRIIYPFLVFSGMSIFWSISRNISIYRWVTLVAILITGGYFGLRYSYQKMARLISDYGIWILFLGVFIIIFMPYLGVHNYLNVINDAWKGLYWHKNHMGLIASFINLLFLINIINSFKASGIRKYIWIILYLFSIYFIIRSDSVAAYLSTIVVNSFTVLALVWLKFRNKIHRNHYLILILILIVISIVLFTNIDHFFGLFNRNTSLTGRIPLWTDLYKHYISKRPYLGYGFNAFWYDESNRVAMQKLVGYNDPIDLSDNGFMDILVNIGFIGLFFFLIFYIGIWWRSIKSAIKATDINGFFPLIVMLFVLIANISWSLIFENESFFMLIMIFILFCTTKNELLSDRIDLPESKQIELPT